MTIEPVYGQLNGIPKFIITLCHWRYYGKKFYGSSLVLSVFILFLSFLLIPQVYAERGVVNPDDLQNTERRIALVIGNSAYKSSPLRNPVNDATDMAAKLRGLGFQVSLGKDLSRKEMRTAIRKFGDDLKRGGVGLFYYAGHGMQTQGKNYLIPVGSNIEREDEIQDERRRLEAEKRLMKERKKLAEDRRKLEEEKEQMKMASLTQDMGKVLGGTRSSDGRYIDHGDGTITDTKTGLMWTKEDSWNDSGGCKDWNDSGGCKDWNDSKR